MLFLFYKEFLKTLFFGLVLPFLVMILFDVILMIFASDFFLFRTQTDTCVLCRDSRTTESGLFSDSTREHSGDYSRRFEARFGPHQHVWLKTGVYRRNFYIEQPSCLFFDPIYRLMPLIMDDFYKLVEPSDLHIFHDLLLTNDDEDLYIAMLIIQRTLGMPLDIHPVQTKPDYSQQEIQNIGLDPRPLEFESK